MTNFIFTSESVSEGHPDKVADQVSDAMLDAILEQDINSKVACEVFVKTGMVLLGGEISTTAWVDQEQLVRQVINDIGYNKPELGFDGNTCAVLSAVGKQSPDIAMGVGEKKIIGAGDQGLMFGYATKQTDTYLPAPIYYAHKLMQRHADLRKNNVVSWLRPDAKSQVTFYYEDNQPKRIDAIVLSTQHSPEVSNEEIEQIVKEEIINNVIPSKYLHPKTIYHINPTGRFVVGGPVGDAGLTGRKIIVDTYGGFARHGGGAFSGKDPSKVDRSASYMARYIAKNLVASGVADNIEVQLSYAIGVAEPVSININTFNNSTVLEDKLIQIVSQEFHLTPQGIIDSLGLKQVKYMPTAAYGHFGRDSFPWERLDKISAIQKYM